MSKLITLIIIILLISGGWYAYIQARDSGEDKYGNALSQAEIYIEHRLYQLAIIEYNKALDIKETKKIRQKLIQAYQNRLVEDEKIIYDLQEVLQDHIKRYGYTEDYIEELAGLYLKTKEPKKAYNLLKKAFDSGIENEDLLKLSEEIRYDFTLSTAEYVDFSPVSNGIYNVFNGVVWKRINADGTYLNSNTYRYVSQLSKDNIALFNLDEDSRLMNSQGVVQGIFDFEILNAGIYSEGLIGIMKDEKWNYYNSFAEKQFGGYSFGGTFIDGKTAVLDNEKWFIINNKGEKQGDKKFDDLILSQTGLYIMNNIIVASENGKYRLYNEKLETVGDFSCDYMDKNTKDGLIAFKKGEKWGFVDLTGKVVINPQYDDAKSFSNGLAGVCVDGLWGFINKENKMVIVPQFSLADYFNSKGVCMVRSNVPNKEGNYYWNTLKLNIGITAD